MIKLTDPTLVKYMENISKTYQQGYTATTPRHLEFNCGADTNKLLDYNLNSKVIPNHSEVCQLLARLLRCLYLRLNDTKKFRLDSSHIYILRRITIKAIQTYIYIIEHYGNINVNYDIEQTIKALKIFIETVLQNENINYGNLNDNEYRYLIDQIFRINEFLVKTFNNVCKSTKIILGLEYVAVGGGDYYHKYLKYKQKYLRLKQ